MNREQAQQVLCSIRDQQENFVRLLQKMVEMETPSDHPDTLGPFFDLLTKELRGLDYHTLKIPGRSTGGQLFARLHNRVKCRPVQLLIGHADTVWNTGTLEKMPFSKNGRTISGPGIYDMKAGIAMMITALRTLRQLELIPPADPVLFINSDEEIGSPESSDRIKRLARAASRVFVLEPSLEPGGRLKTQRKGTGVYTLHLHGRSSHAGLNPEKGASAILELSRLVQQLFALNDPSRGITVNVGTIDGGVRANVVAADSHATVDVRVATEEDARRIDEAIRSLELSDPEVSLQVEGGIEKRPMQQSPDGKRLWVRARALGQLIGLELEDGTSGGASDGNYTNQYAPTLDGLGAVGDGAHAEDEHILLEETLERTALLALLLMMEGEKKK